MGCPRIVLLNVTTVTFIVIALCTHTYMYTCPAPFGADGLINKINLFNSTGVTESYIAKALVAGLCNRQQVIILHVT